MTNEEKDLLLIDLMARLRYTPMVNLRGRVGYDRKLVSVHRYTTRSEFEVVVNSDDDEDYMPHNFQIDMVKPYLRPINTMTKSEIADAIKYICDTDNVVWDNGTRGVKFYFYKSDGIKRPFDIFRFKLGCYGPKNIDWFNKFHFDYRGLIPMGLALPAPEGMYEILPSSI